jgi:hypothetical protein
MKLDTCSYRKNMEVENLVAAQPTMERVEAGSMYISTHSAIIKVGKLIKKDHH